MVLIYKTKHHNGAKHPLKANIGLLPLLVVCQLRRRTHGIMMGDQRGKDGWAQLICRARSNVGDTNKSHNTNLVRNIFSQFLGPIVLVGYFRVRQISFFLPYG